MAELAQKAFGYQSPEREEFSTGSEVVELLICKHEPLGPANDSDDESDSIELTKSQEALLEKSFKNLTSNNPSQDFFFTSRNENQGNLVTY